MAIGAMTIPGGSGTRRSSSLVMVRSTWRTVPNSSTGSTRISPRKSIGPRTRPNRSRSLRFSDPPASLHLQRSRCRRPCLHKNSPGRRRSMQSSSWPRSREWAAKPLAALASSRRCNLLDHLDFLVDAMPSRGHSRGAGARSARGRLQRETPGHRPRMRRRGVPEGHFGPWSNPTNKPCDDPILQQSRSDGPVLVGQHAK